MRGVLQSIIEYKKGELTARKGDLPLEVLRRDESMKRTPLSMNESILSRSGVIAEFKRASPSKGIINATADPKEVAKAYELAGASGISVLTDSNFFSGSINDLKLAKQNVKIPVLRKDFTIDAYQVYESKLIGADCILLIAAILSKNDIKELHAIAIDIGLEVLVEIHDQSELDKLSGEEKIIGINNRNLDTFEVDIENSIRLASLLPDVTKIAESGLGNNSDLSALKSAGFHGFLIGETFMKTENPGNACRDFIELIDK